MALKAYFDDSGSDPSGDIFVLAGYIAPDRKWAQFCDEWSEVLAKEPKLRRFKCAEAMHMRGEFSPRNGWDRELRDLRVTEFANVISRTCTTSLSFCIRHGDFRDTIRRLPTLADRSLKHDHPFAYLWYHTLSELLLHSPQLRLGAGPCNYIFDRQVGFEEEALLQWELFKGAALTEPCPDFLRSWFGDPPSFADDEECLPLQAADLHAWSSRRALSHPEDLKLPQSAIDRLTSMPARHLNFHREHLIAETHKAMNLIREKVLALRDDKPADN